MVRNVHIAYVHIADFILDIQQDSLKQTHYCTWQFAVICFSMLMILSWYVLWKLKVNFHKSVWKSASIDLWLTSRWSSVNFLCWLKVRLPCFMEVCDHIQQIRSPEFDKYIFKFLCFRQWNWDKSVKWSCRYWQKDFLKCIFKTV